MGNKPAPVVGIVCTMLSVLLVVGVQTFAAACGAHVDGSTGSCSWAARALTGVGVVLLVLSLVRIFELDEGERRGLSLSISLLGVLVACLPGLLIDLCASQAMRCQAVMRPFALAEGVALALVAGIDLVRRLLAIGRSSDD
jgi:hypothetical protein